MNHKKWKNRIISALDYILFAILLLCCIYQIKSYLAFMSVFSCGRQLMALVIYGFATALDVWLIAPVTCRIAKRVIEKSERG